MTGLFRSGGIPVIGNRTGLGGGLLLLFCLGVPTLMVREERSLSWVGGDLLFENRNDGHRFACRLGRVSP